MTKQKNDAAGAALKYDAGKPAYELLDWGVVCSVVPERAEACDVRGCVFAWWAERPGCEDCLKKALGKAAYIMCPDNPMTAWSEQVARVLEFGARKYGAHNWRKGMRWSRLVGAALRHVEAFARGELLDPETGLHHLAHFSCCLMFLIAYERDGVGTDDRYRAPAVFRPGAIEGENPINFQDVAV